MAQDVAQLDQVNEGQARGKQHRCQPKADRQELMRSYHLPCLAASRPALSLPPLASCWSVECPGVCWRLPWFNVPCWRRWVTFKAALPPSTLKSKNGQATLITHARWL